MTAACEGLGQSRGGLTTTLHVATGHLATGALAVHADGEILALGGTQMEVEVLPGAITALAPALAPALG